MTPMTIAETERARDERYDRAEVEREFAMCATSRTDRKPTARELHLLKRFGSPVPLEPEPFRLPIDDAVTPPDHSQPLAGTITDRLTPRVNPGVLPREVRIPRPKVAPLEAHAESVYPYLSHEARVLLRLLDQAYRATCTLGYYWAVAFDGLAAAFAGEEPWEAEAAVLRAADELIQAQLACLIPGHIGTARVLFATHDSHRTMLRSRVWHEPAKIPLAMLNAEIVRLAKASLRTSPAA